MTISRKAQISGDLCEMCQFHLHLVHLVRIRFVLLLERTISNSNLAGFPTSRTMIVCLLGLTDLFRLIDFFGIRVTVN